MERYRTALLVCSILMLACIACAGCTVPAGETAVAPSVPVTDTPAVVSEPVESGGGTSPVVATDAAGVSVRPTVVQGGYVRVTVTAPYGYHYVSVSPGGIIPHGQPGVDTTTPPCTQNFARIHVGASGSLSFAVKAVGTDDITVRLVD